MDADPTDQSPGGVLARMRALENEDVLVIGDLPEHLVRIWTSHTDQNLAVVLTGERRRHYLDQHAELVMFEHLLIEALLRPEQVHRNKTDPDVAIFYLRVGGAKFLRVVVRLQSRAGRLKHSVMSCHFAKASEV